MPDVVGQGSQLPIAPGKLIVIIGAGPCGLACGRELSRLGHRNWLILERGARAGGLASSVVDPAGFTWDLGGHVVFSHFGEFDALLQEVMGPDIHDHDRSSYIRFADRWVPYPFQNNLRHLPASERDECLSGLERAPGGDSSMDFAQWMIRVFGEGITRHFMAPYNTKVWATDPAEMSASWIAERVAVIDYARARRNVEEGRDEVAWGPNNRFVFPARGGTGEIYRRLAERLAERIRYRAEVTEVDPEARVLRLADGTEQAYDAVVSTMPLDILVRRIRDRPPELDQAARALRHNDVYMVGVGYETPLVDDKSWMYFPQADIPFYRATNFAKYAAANVPDGDTGRFSAYMTESAFSDYRPMERVGLEDRVEHALRRAGVVSGAPAVASCTSSESNTPTPCPPLAVTPPWEQSSPG